MPKSIWKRWCAIPFAKSVTTTRNALVRDTVCEIGYDNPECGFDGKTCAVLTGLGKQSGDIAMGVDEGNEKEQGAGDQGLMFGYACSETDVLMPAPITYAHRLVRRQHEVFKSGELDWLQPDAKSQVTLRYEHHKPVGLEAVVLSHRYHSEADTAAGMAGAVQE